MNLFRSAPLRDVTTDAKGGVDEALAFVDFFDDLRPRRAGGEGADALSAAPLAPVVA